MPGTRAGRVTVRITCQGAGPEHGRGLLPSRVDGLPEGADRADHHADVEEHERGDDRGRGAVETEGAQRAVRGDQLPEGDTHHHGRQHERHHHEGPEQVTTGKPQPVQDERDRQAQDHREDGGRTGRPHREPQHPVHPRAGEDLRDAARVERPVGEESQREHARDGVDEEQGERGQRHRSDGHGSPVGLPVRPPRGSGRVEARHRVMMSLQSRSHVVRLSAISPASIVSGSGAVLAYVAQDSGSATPVSIG